MSLKKLYIYIITICLLLAASFFLFFTFRFGFDPTRVFAIVNSIVGVFLVTTIIIVVILRGGKKSNVLYQIADWFSFFSVTIIVLSSVVNYFFMPARVIGDSMEQTLHDNDFVITYHFNFTPVHNDVCAILIGRDSSGADVNFVKRIIAIPGDTLSVIIFDSAADSYHLYINDEPYDNSKTISGFQWSIIAADLSVTSFEIPENKYLAFGDNWNNSTDSRAKGLFDITQIRGKVFFRVNPFGAIK